MFTKKTLVIFVTFSIFLLFSLNVKADNGFFGFPTDNPNDIFYFIASNITANDTDYFGGHLPAHYTGGGSGSYPGDVWVNETGDVMTGDLNVSSGDEFVNLSAESGSINLTGGITHDDTTDSTMIIKNVDEDEDIMFKVNDGGTDYQAMRIDGATGRIAIGYTGTPSSQLSVFTTGVNPMQVVSTVNTPTGPNLHFIKSRGWGLPTLPQDDTGAFSWITDVTGLGNQRVIARMRGGMDGSLINSSSSPGSLEFMTTPNQTVSPITRMEIKSDGTVIISGDLEVTGNLTYGGGDGGSSLNLYGNNEDEFSVRNYYIDMTDNSSYNIKLSGAYSGSTDTYYSVVVTKIDNKTAWDGPGCNDDNTYCTYFSWSKDNGTSYEESNETIIGGFYDMEENVKFAFEPCSTCSGLNVGDRFDFTALTNAIYTIQANPKSGTLVSQSPLVNFTRELHVEENLTVDSGTLYVEHTTNRVGIGETNPQYELDVNGDMAFNEKQYFGSLGQYMEVEADGDVNIW